MGEGRPVISLLTDFGEADGYVGIMKGVMQGICPQAQFIDLTHAIPPQQVRQAAFVLMSAVPFFPKGTVHLVVVDPGVGSERRAIAVESPTGRFVAPDNGVLSYALAQAGSYRAVALANPAYRLPEVSHTFHGRDVFSPAAAHLAAGIPLEELGPRVDDALLFEPPRLEVEPGRITGEVLHIDHFGNIGSSINALIWQPNGELLLRSIWGSPESRPPEIRFPASEAEVSVGDLSLRGVATTFSDVEPGQPVAIVGSERALDIAVNRGNAAQQFGVQPGDAVTIVFQ